MRYQDLLEYNIPRDATLGDELDAMSPDSVLEMANLSSKQTGLTGGVIFISTAMANHGPRVKFFLKAGRSQRSFSVTIGVDPKVIANSLPEKTLNKFAGPVIEWVKQNQAALEHFWYKGDEMMSEQMTAFLASLVPLASLNDDQAR